MSIKSFFLYDPKLLLYGFFFTFFASYGQTFFISIFNAEIRNFYNQIIDFEPIKINFTERILACGLQYDFGQGNALSLQYQNFIITDNTFNNINYGISEFVILFSLKF